MTDNDSLMDLVASVAGEAYLKVEENLGDGYVRLRVSEAERRQAKHDIRNFEDVVIELLRNSRDAHAQRVFIASSREGDTRAITVIDDGTGIPVSMHDAIFEPRVTSKLETMVMDQWGVHGRGMALFSVRSNAVSARVASSDTHKGTAVQVLSDCHALSERSDQSTWPEVGPDETGRLVVMRGPHNIVRQILEFSVENPALDVYVGSPAEIVATLVSVARDVLDPSSLLFADMDRLPVWQRPAAASDAAELVDAAFELGLSISERTAHRVLGGEIPVVRRALDTATAKVDTGTTATPPDIYRDRRGLKIHPTDLADFSRELQNAFENRRRALLPSPQG
jgi:hypothetical protein